jgi:CHRD domain-containing protein
MTRLSVLVVAVALFAVGCSSSTSPSSTTPTNPTFTASISPANEIPPITNAESVVQGNASITLVTTKDAANNVTAASATFVVNITGIPAGSTVNIAHIHECVNSCNGSIVVNTSLAAGEVTVTNGVASFTKANITVDPAVAQRILNNPAGFYFNVHSTLNPGGFARGQLTRVS